MIITECLLVGMCGAVDTGIDSYSKGCGFKPRCDQHVVFLSKTLYHNYSTLPR